LNLLFLQTLAKNRPLEMNKKSLKMKKILVIRNDKIGDFMVCFPAFAMLKQSLPDVEITALVPSYTAPLAELCPSIDKVIIDASNKQDPAAFHSVLQAVKKDVAVVKTPEWVRTPHSFSHIFAGGYAAGYYSYLWAEVLSADAFSKFEEEGIFNRQTGQQFLDCILTRGGSEEPMVLFERFRGRKPTLDALLRHKGIA